MLEFHYYLVNLVFKVWKSYSVKLIVVLDFWNELFDWQVS
jgi:hypothetical protein